MTSTPGPRPVGSGPVVVPPPRPVLAAGVLIGVQAVGVAVLAVVILVSGLGHSAALGQLVAQAAYFLIFAAGMAWCGLALLQGRRWGRTPTVVVQIVLIAVGYWLAVPSGQVGWGVALAVVGAVTAGLLFTPPAQRWISSFPALFGPEQGR